MKCYVLEGEWSPKEGYCLNEREKRDHRAARGNLVWKNLRAGIVTREDPQIRDDEVLIRVGACGVCGSDMHAAEMDDEGYTKFSGHLRLPVIMGHEFAGEVVEVGKDVKDYRVGDLIAAEQIRWCGKCPSCRIGKFNNCYELEEIGLSADGAFSEYAVVPEKYCCNINGIAELLGNKQAAMEAGALSEPTGVAYNGMMINGKGVTPGSHVAVFGSGPIGLAAIALARAAGAAKVFAFDTVNEKLELAKKVGADFTYNPVELAKQGSSAADAVMEDTAGIGCKMIVEAAGNPDRTYPDIVQLMSIGANVVQLGMRGGLSQIDLTPFLIKGCAFTGSLGTAGNAIIPSVLRMMEQGNIDMRKIITGRYHLDLTAEAIEDAKSGVHGKILVSQNY
ncbi:scyllo-inosose 3-dehydrogenase [Christensenella timonensis]|uniref:scyllo-inosose 3-dehydrogenase n=1 Tax=Christensenella timonensis TaxID=1816678 RepID=UPI00082D99C3|nr:scyllo-inosose 3-dehydrogenase [Christensenella timonensis]